MNLYNCHTHLFNLKCSPPGFFGNKLAKGVTLLINNPMLPGVVVKVLDKLIPFRKYDKFGNLANMVRIGSKKNQQEVFELLLNETQDWPGMKMVVLSLDMDYMGAGTPPNNYKSQLWELFELKIKNPKRIIPFISIDPRRDSARNLQKLTQEYVEKKGFGGIKLYPPLGFFPFHPNLKEVYKYAEEKQIPVMSHCSTGGIFYQGALQQDQINPFNLNGKPAFPKPLPQEPNKQFKHRFTDPTNFEKVLSEFPKLKVCFAHYGGKEMILKTAPEYIAKNWYVEIQRMISTYENVYTDISYTLHNSTNDMIMQSLMGDIKNPAYSNKILFGTDFFMTIKEKGERKLIKDFKENLTLEEWQQISSTNVINYLKMTI